MIKKAIVIFLLALCVPVFADAKPNFMMEGPCKADYQKLCGDGKTHPARCMHINKEKVSQACKDHMQAKKEEFKAKHVSGKDARLTMREACKKDPQCVAKLKEMREKRNAVEK